MGLGLIVMLAGPLLAIWSIVRLFRNRSERFLYQWQRAFGWLALCVAPVPIVKVVLSVIEHGSFGSDFVAFLVVVPGTWMVLFGGQTVIEVFEQNVKAWTGHRKDTMFDNAHVFFSLVILQGILLTLFVAWRFYRGKSLRDPLVLATGAFMLVNAIFGMHWEWFGT